MSGDRGWGDKVTRGSLSARSPLILQVFPPLFSFLSSLRCPIHIPPPPLPPPPFSPLYPPSLTCPSPGRKLSSFCSRLSSFFLFFIVSPMCFSGRNKGKKNSHPKKKKNHAHAAFPYHMDAGADSDYKAIFMRQRAMKLKPV